VVIALSDAVAVTVGLLPAPLANVQVTFAVVLPDADPVGVTIGMSTVSGFAVLTWVVAAAVREFPVPPGLSVQVILTHWSVRPWPR
jgi:hypothetical protein